MNPAVVDIYRRTIGRMRTSAAFDARDIGEFRVWISRDTEVRDCNGTPLRHPRVERRIKCEVIRDGQVVAFGEAPVPEDVGDATR